MSADDLKLLLEYDDRRRNLLKRWRAEPPPEGFLRCDGYYGCGALTMASHDREWVCSGCGRATLPIGRMQ